MIIITTYCVYLIITLLVTVWVAKTLHENGRAFLIDAFHGNAPLADSINHLLVVGFYLINLGYVSFALKMNQRPEDLAQAMEMLSMKIGMVLLILGGMHFFNIYLFSKMRNSGLLEKMVMQNQVNPGSRNV